VDEMAAILSVFRRCIVSKLMAQFTSIVEQCYAPFGQPRKLDKNALSILLSLKIIEPLAGPP